jgi:type VII secretion protein EccB
MWTQRDQLQAYQFLRRRLVSALQTGDANHPVSPARRLVVGIAVGAACALLIAAGFGIYGLLRPGASQDWRKGGQVIIERETGAVFVFGADGLLHPVVNYASARLLAGGDGRASVSVSARSLAGAPRGVAIGIVGAPESLPAPERLVAGPWTVCAAPPQDGPAQAPAVTTAIVGAPVSATPVDPAQAVLVRANETYAVVDGHRLRIGADAATAAALGYDTTEPVPVTPAWLSAVPAGPDLALIAVPGTGSAGPRVGPLSTVVGQVLVVDSVGSDPRYYVVQSSGLVPVTETEAALILGNPANRAAYRSGPPRAIPVSTVDVAGARAPDRPVYPARVPRPAPGLGARTAVCATSDGGERATVLVADGVRLPGGARPVPANRRGDARAADEVFVPPAAGAVVREQQSPGADTGTVYLLTDTGVRYPIGGPDALRALGYGNVRPVPVASTWLALFPVGVALDSASAQRVVG